MDPNYPGYGYVAQNVAPTESSDTAGIWALVLVIIVIIFIIILAVIFFRDTGVVADLVNYWTKVQGTTTNPEAFVASPNSIYLALSSAPTTQAVTIHAFPEIGSVVVGNRASEFQISNTARSNALSVNLPSGITFDPTSATPNPDPGTINPGQTATYAWLTPTTIRRLY